MFPVLKLVNNTGFESEKNLCFVNSALQLLNCTPRVRTFFKMKEYRLPNEQNRVMQICDEVSRLFNWEGDMPASAAEVRHIVATVSGNDYLSNGSQQDTVEFLITLLQGVEEEISKDNWEAKALIQEFWGIEKNERKFLNKNNGVCNRCKAGPRTEEETFQVLHLNAPDTGSVLTLKGLVQNHFSESSDTAYMRCQCCTHKTSCPGTGVCKPKPFSSRSILVKSPDTLLIQINRFSNFSLL